MADSTIANLTSGAPAQATDVLPIQRGSANFKLAVSDVLGAITALPNGTTATTQSPLDNSTKLATTAYADLAVAAGVGDIQSVVVSLTNTQVNASSSGSNPVQVIATPGAGKLIVPIFVLWELSGGSGFVASGTGIELIWGTVGSSFDPGVTDIFLATSNSVTSQGSGGSVTALGADGVVTSLVANKAINFVNSATATSGGVGTTLKIFVSYRVITL